MASTRSRQRKLARDRYERQMVRRAQRQRRRRQIQAAVGAFLVLGLIVVGSVWLLGGFQRDAEPDAAPDRCDWLPQEAGPEQVEAGTPPGDPPIFGVRTVTLDLDAGGSGAGPVEVALAVESDPCSAASLEHLAGQGFYDGTVCHELSFGALRCGDPSGTGEGGPTYSFFAGTNIPAVPPLPTPGEGEEAELPLLYPAGTVAFGDSAGEGGSQFMIFYRDFHTDAPLWSIIGEVTAGMPLIEAIGAAGTQEGAVAPAETVTIRSLRVTDPDDPGPVDQ